MTLFEFHMPTRILFGTGVLQRAADEVREFSQRAILVTMADLPFVGRVVDLLRDGGIDVTVFDECEPNPRAVTCDRAAALAREKGCGIFVGLGGGSAMDMAKGVDAMRQWLREIGLDISLRDVGVTDEICLELALSVSLQRFANTFYKEKTRADVEKFYLEALNG